MYLLTASNLGELGAWLWQHQLCWPWSVAVGPVNMAFTAVHCRPSRKVLWNSLRCCWWGLLPVTDDREGLLEVCEKGFLSARQCGLLLNVVVTLSTRGQARAAPGQNPLQRKDFVVPCIYRDSVKINMLAFNLFLKIKGSLIYSVWRM